MSNEMVYVKLLTTKFETVVGIQQHWPLLGIFEYISIHLHSTIFDSWPTASS